MKKLLLTLTALLLCFAVEARIVKITLADGSVKVYTTSQLSAVDFNDNGTVTVTGYDGTVLLESATVFDVLTIDDEEAVYEEESDTLLFDIDVDGIPVKFDDTRPVKRLNYVYPSTDPFGNPISLSGTIIIPDEIWNGQCCSEGILLFNHYTIFNRHEAPTEGYAPLESMFLANPLTPNYIMVESDFYGFGATVRFPQAFMQGTNNARASLDGLLAARRILDKMGLDYGPLCFNMGYSSGGFDALATQKLRDMEYADCISFDKTFAGGGPYDISECYRQYVIIDSTAYNAVPLLLMVSTKEIQQMDMEYADVFQPEIACRIDELIHSKNYSSWPVCDSVGRDKKVHEILTADYCDLNSERSQEILSIFDRLSIATDWTPDSTQRLFIFHSRGDDYVPVQSARGILSFLRERGFTPSVIPGKTNLQTNFLVPNLGHLSATLVYLVQSVAAITAWPVMYADGELNPYYAALINQETDIVGTIRQLDALGIDCRSIITALLARLNQQMGEDAQPIELNQQTVMFVLSEACGKMGLTLQDLNEMLQDSGIDLYAFVGELVAYFNEPPMGEDEGSDETQQAEAASRLLRAMKAPAAMTPAARYEQVLRQWIDNRQK